jgi:hypothetical protein
MILFNVLLGSSVLGSIPKFKTYIHDLSITGQWVQTLGLGAIYYDYEIFGLLLGKAVYR